MKKIIIFLITILAVQSLSLINVHAADDISFYEGDYIQGIWITKEKGSTKYYQKARFFMRRDSNQFSYCIEPFAMFNETSKYTASLTAHNLTQEQMKRIALIAHFGYSYGNHQDPMWYAVSQYMIWKEADPAGNIYFTNGLNGSPITAYTNEINEINTLINQYLTLPSIANQNINLVEEHSVTLTDTNHVLENYHSDNPNVSIQNNQLVISNLKEGTHTIHLTRNSNLTSNVPLFYHSDNSQDMTTVGNIDQIQISLTVHVDKTSIDITKIDHDSKTTTASGDAILSGAIYQLYDDQMNEIDTLTINEEMKAQLENLNYGKYHLKEIKAGIGYELDDTIYDFEISHLNPKVELTLENKVIEKEIILHKSYGDGINTDNESNISFDIFNKNDQLYTTITTDENGYAKVVLPFGIYTFKQKNTTDGYKFTDDFIIDVNDKEPDDIYLYDYKIKVPNTSKEGSFIYLIILVILGGIYVQKKLFY